MDQSGCLFTCNREPVVMISNRPSKAGQSVGEEIANAVSHGAGFLAAVAATPVLIYGAVRHGSAASIVGASVFSAAMMLLYLVSTLYHALADNRAKRVFRVLDHSAIYLLIAGTYTPFALGVLRGPWGWTLFGLTWGLAVLGIVFKSAGGMRFERLSVGLYLLMGWLVVIAIEPLWASMPAAGLLWLGAGGVAYTAGIVFYAAGRMPYAHFLWHLCVLAGTACHFIAVLGYAYRG
jgi:hemolysin III